MVRIGQQLVDTKDRYIPKQLNPVFGESVAVSLPAPVQHAPSHCLPPYLTLSPIIFQGVWIHSVLPAGNRFAYQSNGQRSRGLWWHHWGDAGWPGEPVLQQPQSLLWSTSLLWCVSTATTLHQSQSFGMLDPGLKHSGLKWQQHNSIKNVVIVPLERHISTSIITHSRVFCLIKVYLILQWWLQ